MKKEKTAIVKGKYPYEVLGISEKRSMEIHGEIRNIMIPSTTKEQHYLAHHQIKTIIDRYKDNERFYAFFLMGIHVESFVSMLKSKIKEQMEVENVKYH